VQAPERMCSMLHLRVALADKPMDNALCNNYIQ
jgi:hypothetical protein